MDLLNAFAAKDTAQGEQSSRELNALISEIAHIHV